MGSLKLYEMSFYILLNELENYKQKLFLCPQQK